jgi:hypothetical protein
MNYVKRDTKWVTKRELKDVVLIGIVFLHVVALPIQAAIFTTSDLEGSWEIHMLTSGDYPQWTGWICGTLNIDISGNSRFSSINRSDGYSALPGDVKTAISPFGVVTFAGTDFHGVMNSQKDMIVGVMSDSGGGYDLVIYSKRRTSTYNTSDLEGTWYAHALDSGDAPQWIGWYYSELDVNSVGNFTVVSCLNSDGRTDFWIDDSLSITNAGIVSVGSNPSGHARMNDNKDLIVATTTDGGDGYALGVMVKGGGIFATDDLQGYWDFHSLTSGDSPQHTGWAHGTQTIDADGNCSFMSITRSNGDSTIPEDVTVAIASSGVVTHAGTDFHGIMNSRKDTIVGVMTSDWGGYDMVISVRGVRMMYSFASCSAASTNKYNPCAVGYSWIYDGFGEYSGYTKTIDIISTEPVYGVSCFKVRIQDPVEGLRYAWIAEDMQGNAHIFRFQYESQQGMQINSDDDIPNIHLIANPKIGDTWRRDFDGVGTADFEVMSMNAKAGAYENCMKVKVSYAGGGQIQSYYYKEGIGVVKDELWDASGGFILKSSNQAD